MAHRLHRIGIFNHMVDDCEALRQEQHMTRDLDQVFAALADPTRRAILTMLLEDDMAVTDVAEPFDMSLAAISSPGWDGSVCRLFGLSLATRRL